MNFLVFFFLIIISLIIVGTFLSISFAIIIERKWIRLKKTFMKGEK